MSQLAPRTLAASLAALLLGCGPAVSSADSTDGGSGSDTDLDEPSPPLGSSSTGDAETSTDGGMEGESTAGSREPVCGDGVIEQGEACDDGNLDDADGCSAACELSGTIAWSVPLPGGYAVGLSAAEGRAVAAVQQWEDTLPSIALQGHERDGDLLGGMLDVGGFSDLDAARDPVAMLPDGSVALGYAVVDGGPGGPVRHFGVLTPNFELFSEFLAEDERWTQYYGTTSSNAGVFVLHGSEGSLVLEQFDAAGERVAALPLEVPEADHRPLYPGAVPERALPAAVVLTVNDGNELDVWENLLSVGGWTTYAIGEVPSGSRASSFSDGLLTKIWTGAELITLDELDHFAGAEPRTFEGQLLWADTMGLVVGVDDGLVLYDADGAQRDTVTLPSDVRTGARFVRPDPQGGGLFVVADEGVPVDLSNDASVVMHYVVR